MSDLNQSLASLKAACDQPASRLRHYLSTGVLQIWVQKISSLAHTGCADHQHMNIV